MTGESMGEKGDTAPGASLPALLLLLAVPDVRAWAGDGDGADAVDGAAEAAAEGVSSRPLCVVCGSADRGDGPAALPLRGRSSEDGGMDRPDPPVPLVLAAALLLLLLAPLLLACTG